MFPLFCCLGHFGQRGWAFDGKIDVRRDGLLGIFPSGQLPTGYPKFSAVAGHFAGQV